MPTLQAALRAENVEVKRLRAELVKTSKASNMQQTRAMQLKRKKGDLEAAINKFAVANDELKAQIKALLVVNSPSRVLEEPLTDAFC
eukprot:jgi/Tetstr1/448279/TSEL_035566.t1